MLLNLDFARFRLLSSACSLVFTLCASSSLTGSDAFLAKQTAGQTQQVPLARHVPLATKADRVSIARQNISRLSQVAIYADDSQIERPETTTGHPAMSRLVTTAATVAPSETVSPEISFRDSMSERYLSSPVSPRTLDELHGPILRRDLQILSAQSCAAASCHGGPRQGIALPTSKRGNEYQLWFENDPHAQSWRTICSDASLAMMNKLKILDGKKIIDPVAFDNCLACHNTTMRHDEPRTEHVVRDGIVHQTAFAREGVGCAACHGPSEQWISKHFQNGWTPEYATHEGFVNAGDLFTRARMCASCHVGDKDRDMNHDIIAAGHPALRYELATYHSWQPKHWRDAEASDRTYYESQLWLAGQVAAADASLSLIETRANQAHTVSEWPELSAFDCASCHHTLGFKNDRDPLGPKRNAVAPLSNWNDAGLRWLIEFRFETGVATAEDGVLLGALDQVRDVMQSKAKPDMSLAAESAGVARTALYQWLHGAAGNYERSAMRSDRLGQLVASAAGKTKTWETWESAVQFYLAAVAARESWPGGWNGPLYGTADALRTGLRYPIERDLAQYETASDNLETLSRGQAMSLGITLAGWLGNVTMELPSERSGLTYDLGDEDRKEIESKLREIADRWRKVKQANDEKKKAEEKTTEKDKPQPATPPKKQSLDELKKSLEELQGGSADGT